MYCHLAPFLHALAPISCSKLIVLAVITSAHVLSQTTLCDEEKIHLTDSTGD